MKNNLARLIKQSIDEKSVSTEQAFLMDLQRTVTKMNEKVGNPSTFYKPSSMNCIRSMYFQRMDTDVDTQVITVSGIGIGESGTDRHIRIQKYVANMKQFDIDCEYIDVETYIQENNLNYLQVLSVRGMETKVLHTVLNMVFLCDGIIKYNGKYYILEIKTETSDKWQIRQNVDDKHIVQAIAYSTAFQINQVLFIYEDRNYCNWKTFMLTVTDDMKKVYLLERIRLCDKYVTAQKVPPIPVTANKKTCQYCLYKQTCKRIGDTEEIM